MNDNLQEAIKTKPSILNSSLSILSCKKTQFCQVNSSPLFTSFDIRPTLISSALTCNDNSRTYYFIYFINKHFINKHHINTVTTKTYQNGRENTNKCLGFPILKLHGLF